MAQETIKIRVWPGLSEEVYADLKGIAEKEKRKIADMAAILIESAINERKRQKKKNSKGENQSDGD